MAGELWSLVFSMVYDGLCSRPCLMLWRPSGRNIVGILRLVEHMSFAIKLLLFESVIDWTSLYDSLRFHFFL